MKLKQQPEDFQVTELSEVVPGDTGDYALFRLDKTGWTTPDALQVVRTRWQLDGRRISFGGLKDRHAVTAQYFTIFRGPKRNLTHESVTVTYLGQRPEPFTAAEIRGNRFAITIRSLSTEHIQAAEEALGQVDRVGLPNYFDDQRFGSVGDGKEFIAREMVFGRFERALWLALAAPYEFDRADARREKQLLRDRWGDWARLKTAIPKGHARILVEYLASHPTDFKGAVARLRPDLQGLYLAAYQSALWNRMLALWLYRTMGAGQLAMVDLKLGRVPVPVSVPPAKQAEWAGLSLPLPSARLKSDPAAWWGGVLDDILREEGLTLPQLKIKGLQRPFFSKGDRPGSVRPTGLTFTAAADDRHPGCQKMLLKFDLSRGSYATILVKRIMAASAQLGDAPTRD
jgi:tRNA pseudouridine13 synthase